MSTRQDFYHHIFFLFSRQHRHSQRQPEADPGPDLVPDRPLPVGRLQLPTQEVDVGLAEGCPARLSAQKLHQRLEQRNLPQRTHRLLSAGAHARMEGPQS